MPRSRPSLRVIEVDSEHRKDRWLLWMLAGAAIGVAGGVLAAEKFSGRKPSAHTLLRRVRGLSKAAFAQWGPMLDLALQLKEIWDDRQAEALEDDEDEDDELEDADEYEEADPPAAAFDDDDDDELDDDELDDDLDEDEDDEDLDEDDEEFDEDLDEDLDDDAEDEDDDDDEDEDELIDELDEDELDDAPEIGVRVLEAFSHDPILAERAIEIEADDDGAILLHGTVHASREVSHAVTLARGVPGVTRVKQRLSVRGRR